MRCISCGYDNLPEARYCANCGSGLVAAIEPPVADVTLAVVEYAGFGLRLAAAIIDGIIITLLSSVPVVFARGLPGIPGVVLFWLYYWLFTGLKGQTPGKMALGIRVVDEQGNKPGLERAALREIAGRLVSSVTFLLGFLWIIWDGRRQGWHDKIARTFVVRAASGR